MHMHMQFLLDFRRKAKSLIEFKHIPRRQTQNSLRSLRKKGVNVTSKRNADICPSSKLANFGLFQAIQLVANVNRRPLARRNMGNIQLGIPLQGYNIP